MVVEGKRVKSASLLDSREGLSSIYLVTLKFQRLDLVILRVQADVAYQVTLHCIALYTFHKFIGHQFQEELLIIV